MGMCRLCARGAVVVRCPSAPVPRAEPGQPALLALELSVTIVLHHLRFQPWWLCHSLQ